MRHTGNSGGGVVRGEGETKEATIITSNFKSRGFQKAHRQSPHLSQMPGCLDKGVGITCRDNFRTPEISILKILSKPTLFDFFLKKCEIKIF